MDETAVLEHSEIAVGKGAAISVQDVLSGAMKLPLVKINREKFLRRELLGKFTDVEIDLALKYNPAYAGIERDTIDKLAKKVINFETNKVSAISFAAGLPGGWAMAATIPADVTQYFAFVLRIMQELAYLYGFEQFELDGDDVNSETMNQVMLFMGVMFGVQGANAGVKAIATAAAKKVSKTLAQKALTKGTVYPIVKKVSGMIGIKMTKTIFANGVSKIVPIVGGVTAGGLTYLSFRPSANRLKKCFQGLNLCNPEYYRNPENFDTADDDIDIIVETESEAEEIEQEDASAENI